MDQFSPYKDIAGRCNGDIYIGVVGPVRTGKSSFIKRFMELMVLPNMEDAYERGRATDELPQSADGSTIMTTQPRFVPGEAAAVRINKTAGARVRLVDCVGYLIDGALGTKEGEAARMVRTPWFENEIPFEEAAETGTRRVITEHATVAVVVTSDGSIVDLPREAYREAEERVVHELKALGKPFIVVLNSRNPQSAQTRKLGEELSAAYAVPVLAQDVANITREDIEGLLERLLFEFPIREIRVDAPSWLTSLDGEHWLGKVMLAGLKTAAADIHRVREHDRIKAALAENEYVETGMLSEVKLNRGEVEYRLSMQDGLFYRILGEACGQEIAGEEHLFDLMRRLVCDSREYEKVAAALKSVRESGYGVVLPQLEELNLNEPQIARQGAHFGVKLRASAPSVHMVRVDLAAEVSPIVGTEQQSQELVENLMKEYHISPEGIWSTEVFGKPLRDLVRDEMGAKLKRLPDDARAKLQESLAKVVNEGTGGMICILL